MELKLIKSALKYTMYTYSDLDCLDGGIFAATYYDLHDLHNPTEYRVGIEWGILDAVRAS
jgi:hypothetical protein